MVKKRHDSRHHIIPISRRGEEIPQNETDIDPNVHDAWHTLFGNLLVEEVVAIIQYVWQDNFGQIKVRYLLGEMRKTKKGRIKDKRFNAWQIIFGNTCSAKQAIKIIKEKFTKRTP